MKIIVIFAFTTSLSTFLAISPSMSAQSILFQNLNFEQANPGPLLPTDPPSAPHVPVANALPDWSVFYGSSQQSYINVNAPSLGSTAVTLIAPGGGPIDGNYSVLLQGGITASAASISQTGLIPFGTQSLFFEAQVALEPFEILIGTQIVPFAAIGSGPDYTLYGANISAWADKTEQLTFSALENENSYWIIDDISFSPNAVPEPSIVALSAIGGLLFGARKWFARRC